MQKRDEREHTTLTRFWVPKFGLVELLRVESVGSKMTFADCFNLSVGKKRKSYDLFSGQPSFYG